MSFSQDLDNFSSRATYKADAARRKIAIEIFDRVIRRSPVDTGRFRGNWQASVGDYARGTIEQTDPTGGSTSAAAMSVVLSDQTTEPLYLVNNLPYSGKLEYGHSQQAPGGMVRVTIAEFSGVVKKVTGVLK